MAYELVHGDCMEWVKNQPVNSFHAICTDPPYGLVEFAPSELRKLRAGRGGVWRIPPKLNGHERSPLPRFSVLSDSQRAAIEDYFALWAQAYAPVLVPGSHVLVASNSTIAHYVQMGMTRAGFEVRGTLIRAYWTFRGGDRPKNAEREFPEVSVTPRGEYEPWLLFRKPISEPTVAANLRRWGTGGLRRPHNGRPFSDLIPSGKTPKEEEAIFDHPCLKPQSFMRTVVRALLPLGKGRVLDPFMGSGSTIAACAALEYEATGVEIDETYFHQAKNAIPRLASIGSGQSEDPLLEKTVHGKSIF